MHIPMREGLNLLLRVWRGQRERYESSAFSRGMNEHLAEIGAKRID